MLGEWRISASRLCTIAYLSGELLKQPQMTTQTTSDVRASAEAWISGDPDEATRQELRALLSSPDLKATDLADRFAQRLEFGTAGLRGVIGAGPNRMNIAVVRSTSWGLGTYLLEAFGDRAKVEGVVIGYDGRKMSREFAEDAACTLAALSIPVYLFSTLAPTPLTAFAVKHLKTVCGVMVTASHNPPEYNGYKVYWDNGAQIISPIDANIAKVIDRAPPANEIARSVLTDAIAVGTVRMLDGQVAEAYLEAAMALSLRSGGDRAMPIVYTPMHGVGNWLCRSLLARAHFTNVTSVPEQEQPDGAFPTVAFPNPEEKGAMDLAFALGVKMRARLILANDPDADRLAVAIPAATPTGFYQLTGNQVGAILGHYILTKGPAHPKRLVIASIVSSPMLGVMANALGVRYEETLTGFKWIANRALDLKKSEELDFVFGYEEALGYTVGTLVRDKDGVSAALLFAELAATYHAEGKSIHDVLDALYREYGLFVSSQVNLTKKGTEGAKEIADLMDRLRKNPPKEIGGLRVTSVSDYKTQIAKDAAGKESKLSLPPSNVLTFYLEGGSRIIARPSGTEPKVKFYFDVREAVAQGEPMAQAEARAQETRAKLEKAFSALST